MDRALGLAPACHRFKILKAECLAMLGRYPEAQSVARYITHHQALKWEWVGKGHFCAYVNVKMLTWLLKLKELS